MATISKRHTKKGAVYQVRVRKNKQNICKTFTRKKDALEYANKTERAIETGKHISQVDDAGRTVKDLIDRYQKTVLERHYGQHQHSHTRYMLNYWNMHLGRYAIKDINPAMIAEVRDKLLNEPSLRKKQLAPATVNHYLICLSHVFKVASEEWNWITHNPVKNISKAKVDNARTRFLSHEERSKLLNICRGSKNKFLYLYALTALTTGARKSEIRFLKWIDVDFEKKLFRFVNTKNGDSRSVFMVQAVMDELQAVKPSKHKPEDYVFKAKYADYPVDLYKEFSAAFKQAGLKNFRFHDLRHTVASHLAMNGATLIELSQVLGHRTMNMVKRYAHLTENHTGKIIEKMSGEFL